MKPAALVVPSPPSESVRVPNVRPLPVERTRELLGAEAHGLTDDEVREIAYAISRHVAAAFGMATTP